MEKITNDRTAESDSALSSRAVSPVIGVILMVAITVILAAVIGAFVLEIGDQQETAPSTSYDSEQKTEFLTSGCPACANVTVVYITHAGGDVNDISQTDIVVAGNSSMWGVGERGISEGDEAVPQPNIIRTMGTNEPVEFSSGNSWNIIGGNNGVVPGDKNLTSGDTTFNDFSRGDTGFVFSYGTGAGCGNDGAKIWYNQWNTRGNGCIRMLESDDQVNVVWEASSGGKTQNLFKYTVQ